MASGPVSRDCQAPRSFFYSVIMGLYAANAGLRPLIL